MRRRRGSDVPDRVGVAMKRVRWYWWVIGSLTAVVAFFGWFIVAAGFHGILILTILDFLGFGGMK